MRLFLNAIARFERPSWGRHACVAKADKVDRDPWIPFFLVPQSCELSALLEVVRLVGEEGVDISAVKDLVQHPQGKDLPGDAVQGQSSLPSCCAHGVMKVSAGVRSACSSGGS